MQFKTIGAKEAFDLIDKKEATYIDVRTIEEWEEGHVKDAVHIPMHSKGLIGLKFNPDFIENIKIKIPTEKVLVIGCAAGVRSEEACNMLAEVGYKNLYNLEGGFSGKKHSITKRILVKGWKEEGLPVV